MYDACYMELQTLQLHYGEYNPIRVSVLNREHITRQFHLFLSYTKSGSNGQIHLTPLSTNNFHPNPDAISSLTLPSLNSPPFSLSIFRLEIFKRGMDPSLDLPPPAIQPAAAVPAANPTPTHLPSHNHPPYAEMIAAAISALNERNGSSKRAIAKHIETHYSNLPPTHSALLTHHLKRLKNNGQLLMVKQSYKLPRSSPVAVNGAINAVSSDPASAVPKKRPGRPPKPKPKPDSIQAAVPVFVAPVNMNAVPAVPGAQPPQNIAVGPGTAYVAVGPVNGSAPSGPARRRGRPPKQSGVKRQLGRPPASGRPETTGGGGRGRGRPRKHAAPSAPAAQVKGSGRPRGRPPKLINMVEGVAPGTAVDGGMGVAPVATEVATGGALLVAGGGVSPVAGKRRGRPPKAGVEAKKPRKLSAKPLGRPKKNASATVTQNSSAQLLVAYLELKGKLENVQSRIMQSASVIKPCLNSEAAVSALEELEKLASMNVNAPSNVQSQQPQPQQPQPQQPHP